MLRQSVVFIALVVTASLSACDVLATDSDDLQGAWEMLEVSVGGQEISTATIRSEAIRDAQLTFELGSLKLELVQTSQTLELPVTFNETSEPKQIDIQSEGNKLRKGIYELKGDELKLCLGPDDGTSRPSNFVDLEGEPYIYLKLQRIK